MSQNIHRKLIKRSLKKANLQENNFLSVDLKTKREGRCYERMSNIRRVLKILYCLNYSSLYWKYRERKMIKSRRYLSLYIKLIFINMQISWVNIKSIRKFTYMISYPEDDRWRYFGFYKTFSLQWKMKFRIWQLYLMLLMGKKKYIWYTFSSYASFQISMSSENEQWFTRHG